jgi:hypothetical protein
VCVIVYAYVYVYGCLDSVGWVLCVDRDMPIHSLDHSYIHTHSYIHNRSLTHSHTHIHKYTLTGVVICVMLILLTATVLFYVWGDEDPDNFGSIPQCAFLAVLMLTGQGVE